MTSRKGSRFISVSCSHGDQIDPIVEKAVLAFIADYKPAIRVHHGDAYDLRNLRKGASDEEKLQSLEEDYEAGNSFLRQFYQGGKKNYFLYGNHDARLVDLTNSAVGLLRDYANDNLNRIKAVLRRCEAKTFPYDARLGVLKIGDMKFLHGYFLGKTAAQKHAAIYGKCLFGHVHSVESAPLEQYNEEGEARALGCLCKIDMDYNARQPNKLRHQNAWCYGTLFDDGSSQVFQAVRNGDNFYAATNIIRY